MNADLKTFNLRFPLQGLNVFFCGKQTRLDSVKPFFKVSFVLFVIELTVLANHEVAHVHIVTLPFSDLPGNFCFQSDSTTR